MNPYTSVLRNIREERVLETLRALVKLPTLNPPGNEEEGSFLIRDVLERRGIEVELQEVLPRRPNVVARIKGEGKRPSLLFDGHIDVVPVPEGEQWVYEPFSAEVKDGRVYGRGSADAKGSLAAMIEALIAVQEANLDLRGEIALLATVSEERGHVGVQKAIERGLRADMAVVGEPTGLRLCIAAKGVCRVEYTTLGRAAHAGRPWLGVNAVYKMAGLVTRLEEFDEKVLRRREHALTGCPSLAVTIINGGSQRNMVPGTCKIHVDRRLIPGETPESAREEMNAIVGELTRQDPEFKAKADNVYDNPAAETSGDETVVRLLRGAVTEICGVDPGVSGFEANCEMSDLVSFAGIPTVVFGPGDLEMAHTANENVEIEQVVKAARVYALAASSACL